MDHNLEDSINMESIDSMDFDHSGVVVNQEDIALEGNQEGMSMDLDTIEEQQALMDSAHEEIIVSDIMGSDQFAFQEYTMQSDNSTGANITVDANLNARNEQQLDLQFADNANKATSSQHNIITIKAVSQRAAKKAPAPAPYPRQVAIAPKPTKGAPNVQYAIAPKPVALVSVNKAKNVQGTLKGNTVLAQIGKQFLMMPAGAAGQKIKVTSLLHPSGSNESIQIVRCNSNDQAQLTANKGTAKQVRTKYIVQGSDSATNASPAVITKLVPVSAAQPRYVMQQKTVPISIGDKMMITTSPKSVKVAPKNQIIAIKPQAQTVVASQANVTTKKVVISANPTQNVILKAGTKTVNAQQIKTTSLIQTQQRTQLHPINVPGKGIQFIKLVTNQATTPKAASKPPPLAVSAKSFVLTDSKGNIIQMSTDKVLSQPPPLIVASTAVTTSNTKLVSKAKKIRIAPISFKAETTTTTAARSSQSLLAPLETPTTVSLEEYNSLVEQNNLQFANIAPAQTEDNNEAMNEDQEQTVDVKPTLASLISDAVAGEESIHENEDTHLQEVEIEYDNTVPQKQERYIEEDDQNSMEQDSSHERIDENIIIVPSNLTDSRQHVDSYQDESNMSMGDTRESENLETDVLQLLSPKATQNYEETPYTFEYETRPEMPDLRPRKACNCTKSQCLKLYCDCFANGEFCNKCNCTNCHNNLDNEELRQKAIRACLERNPNAFRPKIGKGKTGGPEIIRRHNKGCNCKRSGCLKNYCECYEAKIACTLMCKCVGCRNVQETLERRRYAVRMRDKVSSDTTYRPPAPIDTPVKQPCSFMTPEVIEAVSQCMLATVAEGSLGDPVEDILVEFSRCMADIITASHHAL